MHVTAGSEALVEQCTKEIEDLLFSICYGHGDSTTLIKINVLWNLLIKSGRRFQPKMILQVPNTPQTLAS